MPTIRPCQPKDQENMRYVCIQSGPAIGQSSGPAYDFELATYCDYYVECEPENCFVIADEDDNAVGYIMGAQDYWRYRERFLREYVPRVKDLRHRVMIRGAAALPRLFVKKYPAHLHIDILEGYQRMGLGTQLMDLLTGRLRELGVPGVMLGVGAGNVKGRSFYTKYGFKKLLRLPGAVVMGLDLR